MLNLFSTNQSQSELKFLFKFVAVVFKSGPVKTRQQSSDYKRRSQSTEFDISFTYKRQIRGPKMKPWGTPQDRVF